MTVETLSIVGGGSAYAPGLIAALIHHAGVLSLREVRLHDIDTARLRLVTKLCDGLSREAAYPFRVVGREQLDDAVRGVDSVLNATRPGGFQSRLLDEALPLELGIPGQETVGPGGFLFALRSVPVALEIARRVRALAPNAIFLNYTNPTNIVTQALSEAPDLEGLRVVGLCDQSDEDLEALGAALGVPEAARHHVRFSCVGLNHATWYRDLAFGEVALNLEEVPNPLPAPPGLDWEHALRFELSCELAAKHRGFWPNSYLPYYTSPKRFVAEMRRRGTRTETILKTLHEYFQHFEEQAAAEHPKLSRHRGSAGFGDLAVRTLRALDAPEPERLVLNLPNRGSASCFSAGTVIECVALVSKDGIVPETSPEPPPGSLALLRALEHYQRATAVVAAEARDGTGFDRGVQALAANPLVRNAETARALLGRAKEAFDDLGHTARAPSAERR